jgi:acyl-[acyl-carrier-protein] desaturase
MAVSIASREKAYRAYNEFFDVAERKRRWHPFNDVPWEKMDRSKHSEETAICLETFCGVELYVPDYTANGFNLTRDIFGHGWFQANWGYEESKHGLVFREYLVQSGLRTLEQYYAFEDQIFGKVWKLPFHTRRQMTCYGALQESATFLIYQAQKEKAKQEGAELLETLFFLISRDEAAHHGFYKKVIQLEIEDDREGTIADLAHVIANFQMPGVGLIPEYDERLKTAGVAISPDHFLQQGIFPLLKAVGTSRREIIAVLQKKRVLEAQAREQNPALAPVESSESVESSEPARVEA